MMGLYQTLATPWIAFILQSFVVAGLVLTAGTIVGNRLTVGVHHRIAIYRAGIAAMLVLVLAGPALRLVLKPWYEVGAKSVASTPDRERLPQKMTGTKAGRALSGEPGLTVRPTHLDDLVALDPILQAQPAIPNTDDVYFLCTALLLLGSLFLMTSIAVGTTWVKGLRALPDPSVEGRLNAILERIQSRNSRVAVRLCLSPQVRSPFVAGVFHPTIYLPTMIESQFDEAQIEAILCHELVHVRQGDCLWALLARVCCALTWVNPLTWILARQLKLAAEEYCDQLVIGSGIETATYAGCLVRVAETIAATSAERLVGAGVFPAKSHLSKRITLMLNSNRSKLSPITRKAQLRIVGIVAVAGICACLLVSASPIMSRRVDATPEATISGFISSFNARDWKGFLSRIEGAKAENAATEMVKFDTSKYPLPTLQGVVDSVRISGDVASVKVNVTVSNNIKNYKTMPTQEAVTLHQVNGSWLIFESSSEHGVFNQLILIAKDPAAMAKMRAAEMRTAILSNFKQIGLAVIMYVNDQDDIYRFNASTWKAALKPYLKNENVWLAPDGKPLDIRLNQALIGKSMTVISQPANTVMLSLGPKGNLIFDNNLTPITFTDGHAKYMNREAVSKVLWK